MEIIWRKNSIEQLNRAMMPWKESRKPLRNGWRKLVDQTYMILAM